MRTSLASLLVVVVGIPGAIAWSGSAGASPDTSAATAALSAVPAISTYSIRVTPRIVKAGQRVSLQVSGVYSASTCQVTLIQGKKTGKGLLRVSSYSAKGQVTVPRTFLGQTVARVACGKDGTATSSPFMVVGPNDPTTATCDVLEKGFSQSESNYAYLGMTVRNSSPNLSASDVEIAVSYRDAGGQVIKTDSVYLYDGIPAASTVVLSELTDVGMKAASVTVTSKCATATEAVDPVLPAGGQIVAGAYSTSIRGDVRNTLARTIGSLSSVHYLVRNGSGVIVGGGMAFLDSFVTPGGTGTWDDFIASGLPYTVSDGVEATVFVDYDD